MTWDYVSLDVTESKLMNTSLVSAYYKHPRRVAWTFIITSKWCQWKVNIHGAQSQSM